MGKDKKKRAKMTYAEEAHGIEINVAIFSRLLTHQASLLQRSDTVLLELSAKGIRSVCIPRRADPRRSAASKGSIRPDYDSCCSPLQ